MKPIVGFTICKHPHEGINYMGMTSIRKTDDLPSNRGRTGLFYRRLFAQRDLTTMMTLHYVRAHSAACVQQRCIQPSD